MTRPISPPKCSKLTSRGIGISGRGLAKPARQSDYFVIRRVDSFSFN